MPEILYTYMIYMYTDYQNHSTMANRMCLIKPFRKEVRALASHDHLLKIKYLKISVICGLYNAYIVYENDIEQSTLSFMRHNIAYINVNPCIFQDTFAIPHGVDKDIRKYIICDNVLTHLVMRFPARVYHYPHSLIMY